MLFLSLDETTRNYTEDTRQRKIIHDDIMGYASSGDILRTDLYWKMCSGRCRSDVKSTTRTNPYRRRAPRGRRCLFSRLILFRVLKIDFKATVDYGGLSSLN